MLTSGDMPEYLFRRTSGVVGLLERLIEDGCSEAIGTGEERLTADLLDGVDISLGNLSRRDPAAGEVPPVPARPRTRAKRRPATPSSMTAESPERGQPGEAAAPQPRPACGRVAARFPAAALPPAGAAPGGDRGRHRAHPRPHHPRQSPAGAPARHRRPVRLGARLSGAEASSLTLGSLGRRYPPLDLAADGRMRQAQGATGLTRWVFTRSARYCPECLSGSGTLVETRHGGS